VRGNLSGTRRGTNNEEDKPDDLFFFLIGTKLLVVSTKQALFCFFSSFSFIVS